jgi:hypothetical protein
MHHENFCNNPGSKTFNQVQPENIIQIDRQYLLSITEKISVDTKCQYRQATLRIFNHLLASADEGRVVISARQLSKKLGIHYDTVTKCIKYLKGIGVIKVVK